LIICIFSLTLIEAESLALKNSRDIIILEENLRALEDEYRSSVFSFTPSIYFKSDIPSISYYSDEIYYPSFPEPIPYWERYDEKGGEIGITSLLPTGGELSFSYRLYNYQETYNLYKGREYYEQGLNLSLSQPISFMIASWERIREKKIMIEEQRINLRMKKKEILKNVIRNYIEIYIYNKIKGLTEDISKSAEFSIDELDYLYKNGLIDKVEYLRRKGKYGLILLENMRIEMSLEEVIHNLESLTGCDKIDVSEPEILEIKGKPLPYESFLLSRLELEKEFYLIKLSHLKNELYPSLDISLSLGLRGKGDIEDAMVLKKNMYNIGVSLKFPVFDLSKRFEISSIKHKIRSIEEEMEKEKKEVDFKRDEMERKKIEIRKRMDVLKDMLSASEEILKGCDIEKIPFNERIEIITDYINSLKSFGDIMKEYFILSIDFENMEIEK